VAWLGLAEPPRRGLMFFNLCPAKHILAFTSVYFIPDSGLSGGLMYGDFTRPFRMICNEAVSARGAP